MPLLFGIAVPVISCTVRPRLVIKKFAYVATVQWVTRTSTDSIGEETILQRSSKSAFELSPKIFARKSNLFSSVCFGGFSRAFVFMTLGESRHRST